MSDCTRFAVELRSTLVGRQVSVIAISCPPSTNGRVWKVMMAFCDPRLPHCSGWLLTGEAKPVVTGREFISSEKN